MVHTIETIKALLDRNVEAVRRALVVLYNRQTLDEQQNNVTHHLNGRGFCAFDADFGSSLAKQVLEGRPFSPRQIEAGRKLAKKYARQLVEEANSRQSAA